MSEVQPTYDVKTYDTASNSGSDMMLIVYYESV